MEPAGEQLPVAVRRRKRRSRPFWAGIWHERSELLRRLVQRSRFRNNVAALFNRCWLGPLHGWILDVVPRGRLHICIRLPVGMDAVPVWKLGVRAGMGMGMGARRLLQLEHGSGCV